MARPRFRPFPYLVASLVLALCVAAPAAGFLSLMAGPSGGGFLALSPVQIHAIRETSILMLGIAVLAGSMGVVCAWLVAVHDFPGRRAIEIALVLPLALPTYLAAFVAVDLLDFFGPVQGALRWVTGARLRTEYAFFEIRTLGGAIVVMSLVLFPYIYIPCRLVFGHTGRSVIDAARLLGARGGALFFRIGLPLARPAIIAGLVLALLEALNDIGATEHLGVASVSVAIRDLWLNRSDLPAAARLAAIMIVAVMLLVLLDRGAKGRRPHSARGASVPRPIRLSGMKALVAMIAAGLPALLGFLVPTGFLIWRAMLYAGQQSIDPDFLGALAASIGLAASVALIVAGLAALLAIAARIAPRIAASVRLAAIGYAIPGTVLVLALFPILRLADDGLAALGLTIALSGTITALLFALSIRFLGIGAAQAGLALRRLPVTVDHVARIHGMADLRLALRVHLPAMLPGLALGAILVFIDTIKELPATLLLRPLNFETLATRAYAEASAGTFEHAAIDSLAILALSGIAALMLMRKT